MDAADSEAPPGCTCWVVRTETGDTHPLSWVRLHDQVRLTDRQGRVWQGPSPGAGWWGPPESPQPLMEVETAEGTAVFESSEILTVAPMGGILDIDELIAELRRLVTDDLASIEHASLSLLVAPHETVDVEVRFNRHQCSPTAYPPWQQR